MTFKEKYLAGEIEFEAIDEYIDIWNNSDDDRTLAKFLGLNAEEEDDIVVINKTGREVVVTTGNGQEGNDGGDPRYVGELAC